MVEVSKDSKRKKAKQFIAEYSNEFSVGLVTIGIILTLLFISKIKETDRTLINILSIIGTMASLFGLTIAFIQIVALKEISVVTQRTIHDTKDKLMLGISISDVTEAIMLVREIESYIGDQKFEIARLKLVDLREKVIQFKSSKEFTIIVQTERIKEIIELLNNQIAILYVIVYSEEEELKYNSESLNGPLQEISTHLSDFRNQIKYNTV